MNYEVAQTLVFEAAKTTKALVLELYLTEASLGLLDPTFLEHIKTHLPPAYEDYTNQLSDLATDTQLTPDQRKERAAVCLAAMEVALDALTTTIRDIDAKIQKED